MRFSYWEIGKMEKTENMQEKKAQNSFIATRKGKRQAISFGNEELFEDFMSDYLIDLKKEFLQGRSEDLLNDYEMEVLFDLYCRTQFFEWLDEVRYKYV